MSEAPAGIDVGIDFKAPPKIEPSQIQAKNELVNPRVISQKQDVEGRNILLQEAQQAKENTAQTKTEIGNLEAKIEERQDTILVKLKNKLKIPDQKTIELQAKLLETNQHLESLPKPREMLDAYYEKMKEKPLTNQEKRDLLKPDVLSQLTTDEYIDLWRRLNPYYMTHATANGFLDQTSGPITRDTALFRNGFTEALKNEKQIKSRFEIEGLSKVDKATVTMFLSNIKALQQENEDQARELFRNHISKPPIFQDMPGYTDGTSVHLAPQGVNKAYAGEGGNEIFYCFPTDMIASQYDFGLLGMKKDLTKTQGEGTMWDDAFIWPTTNEIAGISIDAGIVFLPGESNVDPGTGSVYATETSIVDGREVRHLIEDKNLILNYKEWAYKIFDDEKIKGMFHNMIGDPRNSDDAREAIQMEIVDQLNSLGFDNKRSVYGLARDVSHIAENYYRNYEWRTTQVTNNEAHTGETKKRELDAFIVSTQNLINGSFARFKLPETTINGKDYWENYFSKNPQLRPKHVVYYNQAVPADKVIPRFLQENKIGGADTSKEEGPLLGFDDHHVGDIERDPRGYKNYKEVVKLAEEIIKEHYAYK